MLAPKLVNIAKVEPKALVNFSAISNPTLPNFVNAAVKLVVLFAADLP